MRSYLNIGIGLFFLAFFVLIVDCIYTVSETQQVVITQFGEPIGKPITEAGLRVKIPFVQIANYFDKRILQWDGDSTQIPTLDKRFIWVDTTARWRIVDALKFMRTVGSELGAQSKLDNIIESATRDTISSFNLVEVVRNSNGIMERIQDQDEKAEFDRSNIEVEKIKVGRDNITREILKRSALIVLNYGIELVDMRIKRINYVKEVRSSIYERMKKEREAAAEKFLSEGQGRKAEIEGQMQKEREEIESEAYKLAQEIKGKADATAIKIYADAYNKDPEFYAFTKTLETYKQTTDKDTTLIMSTDSDYFEYLKTIDTNRLP